MARLLAYVTGRVNQELLLQVENLAAERDCPGACANSAALSNEERSTLAEMGRRLGREGLEKVALALLPRRVQTPSPIWNEAGLC